MSSTIGEVSAIGTVSPFVAGAPLPFGLSKNWTLPPGPAGSRSRTGRCPRRPCATCGSAACPRRRLGGPSSRASPSSPPGRPGVDLSHEINGLGRPTSSNRGIDSKGELSQLSNPISAGSGRPLDFAGSKRAAGYRRVFHPPTAASFIHQTKEPVARCTRRDAPLSRGDRPSIGQPMPLRAEVTILAMLEPIPQALRACDLVSRCLVSDEKGQALLLRP